MLQMGSTEWRRARYSDYELASAAHDPGNLPKDYDEWFKRIDPKNYKAASAFWDGLLENACPGPKPGPGD